MAAQQPSLVSKGGFQPCHVGHHLSSLEYSCLLSSEPIQMHALAPFALLPLPKGPLPCMQEVAAGHRLAHDLY